jgi:hypothetical protein
MLFSRWREKERFKKAFPSQLLEYHFEKSLGRNEHNGLPWRTLLENETEPHTDILCDFSEWLIEQGWSKEVVEELFFVVADEKDQSRGAKN